MIQTRVRLNKVTKNIETSPKGKKDKSPKSQKGVKSPMSPKGTKRNPKIPKFPKGSTRGVKGRSLLKEVHVVIKVQNHRKILNVLQKARSHLKDQSAKLRAQNPQNVT